jgi:hypothetical protein
VTQPRPDPPHTVLAMLFDSGGQTPGTLAEQVTSCLRHANLGRVLDSIPAETRAAALHEIAGTVGSLLNLNLADLLVEGWLTYQNLTAAARRTLESPASVELVQLVSHQVSVEQRPSIDVLVDGRRVATVELEVSVVFQVDAMLAAISAGKLTAVHAGRCQVTAALALQGSDIATKNAEFELPGLFTLREAIRLLPDDAYATQVQQPTRHGEPAAPASA